MSNNSLLLVDPDFKADASINCCLLLKITNDSFSYAVVEQNSNRVYVIFDKQGCENMEQDLKSAFDTDTYLSKEYGRIKTAVHTANFLFIPNEWPGQDNPAVYSKFLSTEGKIHSRNHEQYGFRTLFVLDDKIAGQLPEHAAVHPQSSPLLALSQHVSADALLIDFTAASFNVLFVKDQQMCFQNHYNIENVHEFNYFLLLMINQLALTELIPVYVQGIINEDDDYYNTLLKYFNNIYFFLPVGKQNSGLLDDMPKHYFSGLLALNLCE